MNPENPQNNPNIIPPVQPVSEPVTNSENSSFLHSKWLRIGVVVVILLVLLGGTFVLGGKLMNKPQAPATTTTTKVTSTPTPALDWIIKDGNVKNNKEGFSFSIPTGWTFNQEFQRFESPNYKQKGVNIDGSTLNVSYQENTTDDSETFFERYKKRYGGAYGGAISSPKIITVDGNKAVQFTGSGEGIILETEFIKNGKLFFITLFTYNKSELENERPAYDQVLSTFKFTNSAGNVANPGEHCGGNIASAKQCTTGYHCQLEKIADLGGTCVND